MKQRDADAAAEILRTLLKTTKDGTVAGKYEAIEPAEDGNVHSFMSPQGTETGRFSHSATWLFEPGSTNLAQLPKKVAALDPLYDVRECIVPEPGRVLWKADYSAAEARWCAWIAEDEKRIRMYREGIDQYRYFVAVLKWDDGSRWEEVPKVERNAIGKVGILSGQYKVSWKTMKTSVNDDADLHGIAIDAKTAKKMVDIWPREFPRTVEWWSEVEEQALSKGYVVNPFGRRRELFGRRDSEGARSALVREAIADGPQSANAMMLNEAFAALYERYDPRLLRVLLTVHDEIVGDCAPEDLPRVARVVKETMETTVEVNGREMLIPAEVEASTSSWSETKQIA